MAFVCLDTDIIIDVIRGETGDVRSLSAIPFGASTTMITLLELYYGAFKSMKQSELDIVSSLSNDMAVNDLLEEDVKLAGRIMAELDRRGRRLDFRDVVIGAICINRDMPLITNNTKHFRLLKEFGLAMAGL